MVRCVCQELAHTSECGSGTLGPGLAAEGELLWGASPALETMLVGVQEEGPGLPVVAMVVE